MSRRPRLIIKADDFAQHGAALEPWRRFFDAVLGAHLKASVGVVAHAVGRSTRSHLQYLRGLVENYGIEVWNHSLVHQDITQMETAALERDIAESQHILEQEVGVRPRIYGPPYNRADARSAAVLQASGEFDGYYFLDGLVPEAANVPRSGLRLLEVSTRDPFPVRPQALAEDMARRADNALVVLQVHPVYWSESCFAAFAQALRRLTEAGHQAIGAADELACRAGPGRAPDPQGRLGLNLAYEEQVLEASARPGSGRFERADSAYYLRMLRRGTSEIAQFLRTIGFFGLPADDAGQVTIADVGCGVGNWACAAALVPGSTVVAIDRDPYHVSHLAEASPLGNIEVRIEDVGQTRFAEASLSGVICNNTISYVELVPTLQRFADWLVGGGRVFVGLQNRLYPLRDAIDCAGRGDWARAAGFLERLVQDAGAAYGLERPFIRYHGSAAFAEAARLAGLLPQRRDLLPPGNYNDLFGRTLFTGHVLVKTRASVAGAAQAGGWPARLQALPARAAPALAARLVGLLGTAALPPRLDPPVRDAVAEATGAAPAEVPEDLATHEPLVFYARARAVLAGQAPAPHRFADPLFGPVLELLAIVRDGSAERFGPWRDAFRARLAAASAHELAHWL